MKHNVILAYFCSFLLVLLAAAGQVSAAEWQDTPYMKLRMLAIKPSDEGSLLNAKKAALHIKLEPDWYTYWRVPGDAGLPFIFTPQDNSGIESIAIKWPVPKRYEFMGLTSFIYDGDFVLPLNVQLKDDFITNKHYNGAFDLMMMVCNKVCVPQNFSFNLVEDKKSAYKPQIDTLLRRADSTLPHQGNIAGFEISTAVLSDKALVLSVKSGRGTENFDVFVDANDKTYFTQRPEIIQREDQKGSFMVKLNAVDDSINLADALKDSKITIVATNGARAIEKQFSF